VTESNSPVQQTPEKMSKDCDTKCVEALNYILRKRNFEAILPIKLVHKEKVDHGDLYMMYEAPNTIIIDDSNEFVQYLYNDKEDLQGRHEVLAIMLGFLSEKITQVIATKPFDFEAFRQACFLWLLLVLVKWRHCFLEALSETRTCV
jgi:hypothetical protein